MQRWYLPCNKERHLGGGARYHTQSVCLPQLRKGISTGPERPARQGRPLPQHLPDSTSRNLKNARSDGVSRSAHCAFQRRSKWNHCRYQIGRYIPVRKLSRDSCKLRRFDCFHRRNEELQGINEQRFIHLQTVRCTTNSE